MKKDSIFIDHILESIEKIERYIQGMDFDSFVGDDKTIDAVVRELTVIGEASAQLSSGFKLSHPDIPLHEAAGMRNRIVHEYWAVDEKTVWDTCKDDLPLLKEQLISL